MARIPMITRSIKATKATVLYVNPTGETKTYQEDVLLSRYYKDNNKILREVKKDDTDEKIAIRVMKTETLVQKYGMSEQDFIKNAKKM